MPERSKKQTKEKSSKKRTLSVVKTSSRGTKSKKYTKKFLGQITSVLKQMRSELLQDVSKSMKEESDHLRFNVGDFYDRASEDRQRELALTLSSRERSKLYQIDDALKRIENGEYGYCEVTGEKIGEERLFAMPFTKLSIEAQEEIEREN